MGSPLPDALKTCSTGVRGSVRARLQRIAISNTFGVSAGESNIAGARNIVRVGFGDREIPDYRLTKLGAYFVFMNGDPRKPEIAAALRRPCRSRHRWSCESMNRESARSRQRRIPGSYSSRCENPPRLVRSAREKANMGRLLARHAASERPGRAMRSVARARHGPSPAGQPTGGVSWLAIPDHAATPRCPVSLRGKGT